MAAKEEWFYGFRFLYINISLRFAWVKFALVAMNLRFLYIICNFFNFLNCLFKHGIQDGRRIVTSYLLVIFAVLSK